jgi:hypothetical protein
MALAIALQFWFGLVDAEHLSNLGSAQLKVGHYQSGA